MPVCRSVGAEQFLLLCPGKRQAGVTHQPGRRDDGGLATREDGLGERRREVCEDTEPTAMRSL